MKESNLKNMVILTNLPSNIVEEAIVILKSRKQARKLEKVNNNKFKEENKDSFSKNYILKEAEMIVSNYIAEVEDINNKKDFNVQDIKYKKAKKISIFLMMIVLIETLIIVF